MAKPTLRIVLDTNIIIRAVSGRSLSSRIFDALLNQEYTLCLSTEILLEYEEKLIEIYDREVAELVISVLTVLPNVIRTEIFYDMRLIYYDVDDDKFVNCAFASNAHFIVTDDGHFKVLQKVSFPKISVLSFLDFKNLLFTLNP
jgi:uncharacterized protein